MDAEKRTEKIIRGKIFWKKELKETGVEFNHRVSTNRLSNNWAQIVMRWERDREIERSSFASDLQQNSDASSKETFIPRILTVCSRFIAFTFDLCDRLSFVCRSLTLAKTKYHYYVDQSELLTRFWTDLTSSVSKFLTLRRRRSSRGEERWLFSQSYTGENSLPHVGMTAKFFDDNKTKIHLKSKFALFQTSSALFKFI